MHCGRSQTICSIVSDLVWGLAALLHDEADRGEHAYAAVRQLALAVPVDLELRLAVEEAVPA